MGAKKSSDRLSDLRLSFFSDCGSTESPSATVVAIAAAVGILLSPPNPPASLLFLVSRGRTEGGDAGRFVWAGSEAVLAQ